MDGELFLDTVRLRDHVADIQQQYKTAQQLYDQLERAKRLAYPNGQSRFGQLLNDAQSLVDYFGAMSRVIDGISGNAEQVSLRISRMLQDNLDNGQLRNIFREV